MSDTKNTKDKMIPNPENPDELIENPDYVEPSSEDDDDDDDDDLSPELKAKFDKLKEKELKKIKEKLNKAYSNRDELLTKVKEFEQKQREAEIAKLKEAGKLEEAYEAQLADRDARLREQEARLVRLTRDNDVKDALASFDFRNERARKAAQREIIEELIQDDKGEWKHKSGASIAAFAKTFFETEDNTFYLKPKHNTGTGTGNSTKPGGQSQNNGPKKLSERSQAEVLQEFREKAAKRQLG
jgi:hypothetical protein